MRISVRLVFMRSSGRGSRREWSVSGDGEVLERVLRSTELGRASRREVARWISLSLGWLRVRVRGRPRACGCELGEVWPCEISDVGEGGEWDREDGMLGQPQPAAGAGARIGEKSLDSGRAKVCWADGTSCPGRVQRTCAAASLCEAVVKEGISVGSCSGVLASWLVEAWR